MTLVVKGFVKDAEFIDNSPNSVSSVFELSPKGMSYARDKQYYSLSSYPASDLIVFDATDDSTGLGMNLDTNILTTVFSIVNLIKAYPLNHISPFDYNDYRDYLIANAPAGTINVNTGPFEAYNSTEYPSWFSFSTTTGTIANVKIYISNDSFLSEYANYDIVIVPPLPSSLEFNDSYATVLAKLAEVTPETFNDRIEQAKGVYPNTYTRVLEFWFHNKNNPTVRTKTYWGAVIYGEAGNDIDNIKDAIEEYILAEEDNVITDWEVMFPDIFSREEFLLIPLWHKVAIENMTVLSNLYSSMLLPSEVKDFLYEEYDDLYAEVTVYDNMVMFPYDYKAITIASLPGGANPGDKDQIFEIFPDYIPVDTSSLDFMRMTSNTREWVLKLQTALITAETMNVNAQVPSGFKKVTRGTRRYVSFYYGSVNYLVAYRYNTMFN